MYARNKVLLNKALLPMFYFILGLHMGGSGEKTMRFRPALIFQPLHANVSVEILDGVLKELN